MQYLSFWVWITLVHIKSPVLFTFLQMTSCYSFFVAELNSIVSTYAHTYTYTYMNACIYHILSANQLADGYWAGSTFWLLWAGLQSACCASIPVIRWLAALCQPPPLYSICHVTLLLVCSPCNSHLSRKSSSWAFSSAFLPEDVYKLICSCVLHVNPQGSLHLYLPSRVKVLEVFWR